MRPVNHKSNTLLQCHHATQRCRTVCLFVVRRNVCCHLALAVRLTRFQTSNTRLTNCCEKTALCGRSITSITPDVLKVTISCFPVLLPFILITILSLFSTGRVFPSYIISCIIKIGLVCAATCLQQGQTLDCKR